MAPVHYTSPARLDILTTLPWDFLINGRKVLVTSIIPHKLTFAMCFICSSGVHSIGPAMPMPALFTSPHKPEIKLNGEKQVISTAKFRCISGTLSLSLSWRNITSYHILASSVNRRKVTWNMESICDEATSVMFSPSWITTTIIPVILKMNPVIFKLVLGFNFSLLCPEGSKSFKCLLFLIFFCC